VGPSPLSPDLAKIAARLSARPYLKPRGGHRGRVMEAVRRELAAGRTPWWQQKETWHVAAVAAAAVLFVWLNVAMRAANPPDWHLRDSGNGVAVAQAAARIHELVPSLPEREAWRQAVVLNAGAHLVPAPQPPGRVAGALLLHELKEDAPWVTQ